jgi:intracellular septation protein A
MVKYLQFIAWLVFRSQGLITYYVIDNYFLHLKPWWILYFVIASSLIYISEQLQKPLLKLGK